MFEAGDGTKLSDDAVKRLSEMFGISPVQSVEDGAGSDAAPLPSESLVHGFCPNFLCPSNVPYVVAGRLFLLPSRNLSSPSPSARRCAFCGEVLEHGCPVCGAPLYDGACCCACGHQYVTPALSASVDPSAWAASRRTEISAIRALMLPPVS